MFSTNKIMRMAYVLAGVLIITYLVFDKNAHCQTKEPWQVRVAKGPHLSDSLYEALSEKMSENFLSSKEDPCFPGGTKVVETRKLSFNNLCENIIFDTLSRYSSPGTLYYDARFITLDGDVYLCIFRDNYHKRELCKADVLQFNSPFLSGAFAKSSQTIYVYGDYPQFIKKTKREVKRSYKVGKDIIPLLDGNDEFVFKIDKDNVIFMGIRISG